MSYRTPPSEWRRFLKVMGGIALIFALAQSITITPSIHGQVIDEKTQAPLAGAAVAALWNLEQVTLHSSWPGGPVKIAETATNLDGEFSFPTAVVIHWPMFPFSMLTRSDTGMPKLIVATPDYEVAIRINDIFGMHGSAHSSGFLSLRSSSLENTVVSMREWYAEPDKQADSRRASALEQLREAESQCSRRWLCQHQSLQRTREMLKRLQPRAVQQQN